jgi:ubiquitin-protein ligase
MITKMFHPNVSKAGEICVDTLKKGWKKEYGVGHVLVVSQIILTSFRLHPDAWRRLIRYGGFWVVD